MGVTLVRVGSSFVSGEQWTAAADAEALRYAAAIFWYLGCILPRFWSSIVAGREWRFVADAAHAAGIYLITNLPIQAWANAVAGIPVSQASAHADIVLQARFNTERSLSLTEKPWCCRRLGRRKRTGRSGR